MKCSLCEKDPSFICLFCGRIICEECRKFRPHVMAAYDEAGDKPKLLVTEDAAWCGKCHPAPTPLEIPEIE